MHSTDENAGLKTTIRKLPDGKFESRVDKMTPSQIRRFRSPLRTISNTLSNGTKTTSGARSIFSKQPTKSNPDSNKCHIIEKLTKNVTKNKIQVDTVSEGSAVFLYQTQKDADENNLSIRLENGSTYLLPKKPNQESLIQFLTNGKNSGEGDTLGTYSIQDNVEVVDFGLKLSNAADLHEIILGNKQAELVPAFVNVEEIIFGQSTERHIRDCARKIVRDAYGPELPYSSPTGQFKAQSSEKPPIINLFIFPLEAAKVDQIVRIIAAKYKDMVTARADGQQVLSMGGKEVSVRAMVTQIIRELSRAARLKTTKPMKMKASGQEFQIGFVPTKNDKKPLVDQRIGSSVPKRRNSSASITKSEAWPATNLAQVSPRNSNNVKCDVDPWISTGDESFCQDDDCDLPSSPLWSSESSASARPSRSGTRPSRTPGCLRSPHSPGCAPATSSPAPPAAPGPKWPSPPGSATSSGISRTPTRAPTSSWCRRPTAPSQTPSGGGGACGPGRGQSSTPLSSLKKTPECSEKWRLLESQVRSDDSDEMGYKFLEDITNEKGVLCLNDDNFSKVVSSLDYVLVHFYAANWKRCKELEPEFSTAAKEMIQYNIYFAQVDATEAEDLVEDYVVEVVPTITLLRKGVKVLDYHGEKVASEIIQFLVKHVSIKSNSPLHFEQQLGNGRRVSNINQNSFKRENSMQRFGEFKYESNNHGSKSKANFGARVMQNNAKDNEDNFSNFKQRSSKDNEDNFSKFKQRSSKDNEDNFTKFQQRSSRDNEDNFTKFPQRSSRDNEDNFTKFPQRSSKDNEDNLIGFQQRISKCNDTLTNFHQRSSEDSEDNLTRFNQRSSKDNMDNLTRFNQRSSNENMDNLTRFQQGSSRDNEENLTKFLKRSSTDNDEFPQKSLRVSSTDSMFEDNEANESFNITSMTDYSCNNMDNQTEGSCDYILVENRNILEGCGQIENWSFEVDTNNSQFATFAFPVTSSFEIVDESVKETPTYLESISDLMTF